VRKTAAINVVKLFDHEIDVVRDNGFLDRLREMLTDATPMVRAPVPHAVPRPHTTQALMHYRSLCVWVGCALPRWWPMQWWH
jgi:vesicle coat complex subunit